MLKIFVIVFPGAWCFIVPDKTKEIRVYLTALGLYQVTREQANLSGFFTIINLMWYFNWTLIGSIISASCMSFSWPERLSNGLDRYEFW